MLTIGITGGIGSGKSTVTDFFAQLGIDIVDADIVARDIVAPGTVCLEKIALHFGPHILDHNGHLNRRKLRDIIFTQPSERAWLEQLTHPLIQEATQHALSLATSPYRIYTAPLLLEVGQNTRVDRVLIVDVPEALQLARAGARDGATSESIRAIMNTQWSREQRLAKADDIIDNSRDITHTKTQVETLHQQYLKL